MPGNHPIAAMKTLVVDDEESARSRLIRLLSAHAEIEVIGEAKDGLEAVSKIEELRPELLFLDIEMPGLTGFGVLRSVKRNVTLPLVIFVTGYDQHALEAFEADALAYLLKPVAPERLSQAVERAVKLADKDVERERVSRLAREAPKSLRQVVCRKRDRLLLMPPEQIFWFQVEDGIVKAHTANDTYWVNYQLSELEASLPEDQFFRARRESLVNLTKIKEIRPYFKSAFLLIMSDSASTEIVVSERQARPFRQKIPGL
jgi:DNA-binding LytR/AlgR family response regulator